MPVQILLDATTAERTILSDTRSVQVMGTKIGKSLVNVEQDELHAYLLSLKERMSQSSWHTALYGIKYCYVEVLELPELVNSLPKSRREQPLPVVLNQVELGELFGACRSLKHRCLFKLAYGTGLRMNELRLLKISEVDSERMRLRVVQGKGRTCMPSCRAEGSPHRANGAWPKSKGNSSFRSKP